MSRPLRVLQVEDSRADAERVLRELERGGYEPVGHRVETEAELAEALRQPEWDIVFSDYSLQKLTGLLALGMVKEALPDLPFILVAGTAGEETAARAMKFGASDCLRKDDLARLNAAVERARVEATRLRAQRLAEQALRDAEQKLAAANQGFRRLFALLPDIVTAVRDGRFLYVNPAFTRTLGYEANEVVGRDVLAVVHPKARATAVQRRRDSVALGADSPQVHPWLHKDGRTVFVEVTAQKIDFEGRTALLTVARDVSDRVLATEHLRASDERFRTLVNSLDDMVFTLDSQQRHTDLYGRWLERDGLSRETFIGKSARDIYGPEAAAPHEQANACALAGERTVYPWSLPTPTGARHFQTSLSPMRDSAGKIIGLVGIGRETTEVKRTEEQLLVADRMVSMGTLAAGVAHEINNPLAAVLANLEFIRQDIASALALAPAGSAIASALAELAEPITDARDAADRVKLIVKDLKVFSRAAEEKHSSAVDVESVLESSTRLAWNEIRHRARLVRDYRDVPPIEGNESRLGQVFLNLLVNAAQAIPEGRFEQNEIRLSTRLTPDGKVEIAVSDTGSGIPPEVQRRLFTPFLTTKPVGVGTGLGLSISQRIVTGLGGTLSFETEVGKGTTFRVTLPQATSGDADPAAPPAPRAAARRRAQVLVVDDEPLIGSSVRRALSTDHDVTVVERGDRALALVGEGKRYDVVFCDLMMPEMTGIELFEQLRTTAPEQAERVVFLTGGAFTPGASTFLESVPNLRLEKPFEIAQLRAAVTDRLR